jgi:hypothetical protein
LVDHHNVLALGFGGSRRADQDLDHDPLPSPSPGVSVEALSFVGSEQIRVPKALNVENV